MNEPSTHPRKVLFLTYGFSLGGAETLLVRLLNAINRDVIEPVVATLSNGELQGALNPEISVYSLPRKSRFDLAPGKTLATLLNLERIDTVVALGLFASLFVRRARNEVDHDMRCFVWVHGTRPRTVKEFAQMMVYLRLLRAKDQIITLCHAQANYLGRLYGVPSTKFLTVHNGIDSAYWTLPPAPFQREHHWESWGMPSCAKVIVQVAMFRPEKRQGDAIRALGVLHRTTSLRPYLVLIGDGDPELIQQARDQVLHEGLDSHVVFTGKQADVRPFLWGSDLLTLASVSETFPTVALEALACGVPCVLTDVGGAREIITGDHLGRVVPSRNPRALAAAWEALLTQKNSRSAEIHNDVEARFPFDGFVHRFEHLLSQGNGGGAYTS